MYSNVDLNILNQLKIMYFLVCELHKKKLRY